MKFQTKWVLVLTLAFVAVVWMPGLRADDLPKPKVDVLLWPQMTSKDFGCYLEKQFGYRDPRFNCSLKEDIKAGDPCRNTQAYYAGPAFPEAKVSLILPSVKSVDLSWEHGQLQAVTLELKGIFEEAYIRRLFSLPPDGQPPRSNIQSVSIQRCSKATTCLILQGFEHLGAGDANCSQ